MVGRGVVGWINWEFCLRCVCVVSVSVLYLCCVCVCVVLCCVCVVGRINWECCLQSLSTLALISTQCSTLLLHFFLTTNIRLTYMPLIATNFEEK